MTALGGLSSASGAGAAPMRGRVGEARADCAHAAARDAKRWSWAGSVWSGRHTALLVPERERSLQPRAAPSLRVACGCLLAAFSSVCFASAAVLEAHARRPRDDAP